RFILQTLRLAKIIAIKLELNIFLLG
ncbi:hypothetical protein PA598K_07181, partial [Paenibacillus sp. 598K]